jgi:hypothetical protein
MRIDSSIRMHTSVTGRVGAPSNVVRYARARGRFIGSGFHSFDGGQVEDILLASAMKPLTGDGAKFWYHLVDDLRSQGAKRRVLSFSCRCRQADRDRRMTWPTVQGRLPSRIVVAAIPVCCQMRWMANKKKTDSVLRGSALIKRAIEVAKANGVIDSPEPLPAGALKNLRLPNDEKISPALKALLAFDMSWLGWAIDEEDPEIEPASFEELVEQQFGEEFVEQFGEAIELLSEDCIQIGEDPDATRFLYVGTPDDQGEYPVITLATDDGCWVGGFVPFDIWVAQQFGALEPEKHHGSVPQGYEAFCKVLAETNSDGRVSFKSESRAIERDRDEVEKNDDDEEEDDDIDDEKDEDDNEDNER